MTKRIPKTKCSYVIFHGFDNKSYYGICSGIKNGVATVHYNVQRVGRCVAYVEYPQTRLTRVPRSMWKGIAA